MFSLATMLMYWTLCAESNIYHNDKLVATVTAQEYKFEDKFYNDKWQVSCKLGNLESDRVSMQPENPGFVRGRKEL